MTTVALWERRVPAWLFIHQPGWCLALPGNAP